MFGEQATRLLREQWETTTLLAEELYAMFQDDIPLSHNAPITITSNNDLPPLTLRNFGAGDVSILFEDADGGSFALPTLPNLPDFQGGEGQQEPAEQTVFAGKIIGVNGLTSYRMHLFPNGPDGDPISVPGSGITEFNVTQLFIEGVDPLPVGIWEIVIKTGDVYVMQAPTFMG